jgi:hypothetical protein
VRTDLVADEEAARAGSALVTKRGTTLANGAIEPALFSAQVGSA